MTEEITMIKDERKKLGKNESECKNWNKRMQKDVS